MFHIDSFATFTKFEIHFKHLMDHMRSKSNTNLPSESRFPSVNVIANLIGWKKTSIDCHMKKKRTLRISTIEGPNIYLIHPSQVFNPPVTIKNYKY